MADTESLTQSVAPRATSPIGRIFGRITRRLGRGLWAVLRRLGNFTVWLLGKFIDNL